MGDVILIYRCVPFVLGTMSVLDLFRNEYVNGKVVDKYKLNNGNLGMVVEDAATRRRYHVEFRDGYRGPSSDNLFRLLKEPLAGKTEYLDHLVEEGDSIGLTLCYPRGFTRYLDDGCLTIRLGWRDEKIIVCPLCVIADLPSEL